MKNKIIKLIGLILILFFIIRVQAFKNYKLNPEENIIDNSFSGDWTWEKNSDRANFDMTLSVENNTIKGNHCIVAQAGRRIDCELGNDDTSIEKKFSIKGTISNGVASVSYESTYSGTKGTAEIRVLPNGKLEWKIINEADGQTYFPNNAILIKD